MFHVQMCNNSEGLLDSGKCLVNFELVQCFSLLIRTKCSIKIVCYYYLLLTLSLTRKNCFRYLKLMSPLNAAICTTTYLKRQKCYGPDKKILFKKTLFNLEVKGQGPMKVIMVRDTLPYGHAPTYQISLTYLERNNYLTLRSKVKVP